MRTLKVSDVRLDLVDLDDDQADQQSKETGTIDQRVEDGALTLLRLGMGGLKDQGSLGE